MDKLSPSNIHPDSYAEVLSPRTSGDYFKKASFKEVIMADEVIGWALYQ